MEGFIGTELLYKTKHHNYKSDFYKNKIISAYYTLLERINEFYKVWQINTDKIWQLTRALLGVRHYSRHMTCINPFNSHKTLSNTVSYPSFIDKKAKAKEVKLCGKSHTGGTGQSWNPNTGGLTQGSLVFNHSAVLISDD